MSKYAELIAHLESVGWQPDKHGDAECVDQGAAMAADAIKELERQRDELAGALRQFAECNLTDENCASMELATIRIRSTALRALASVNSPHAGN